MKTKLVLIVFLSITQVLACAGKKINVDLSHQEVEPENKFVLDYNKTCSIAPSYITSEIKGISINDFDQSLIQLQYSQVHNGKEIPGPPPEKGVPFVTSMRWIASFQKGTVSSDKLKAAIGCMIYGLRHNLYTFNELREKFANKSKLYKNNNIAWKARLSQDIEFLGTATLLIIAQNDSDYKDQALEIADNFLASLVQKYSKIVNVKYNNLEQIVLYNSLIIIGRYGGLKYENLLRKLIKIKQQNISQMSEWVLHKILLNKLLDKPRMQIPYDNKIE